MPNVVNNQIIEAKEAFRILAELSKLLNTGLDIETLTICVRLCEAGVDPQALAAVVRELRKEIANLEQTRTEHE